MVLDIQRKVTVVAFHNYVINFLLVNNEGRISKNSEQCNR